MSHPLVVIGAGPTGLAAAAEAWNRGLETVVLEAGPKAGSAVLEWAHVRLFSPWSEVVNETARTLLSSKGWEEPEPTSYPTGADWATKYLQPLADALIATEGVDVRYGNRVTGVARQGRDLMVDSGREDQPFVIHLQTPSGEVRLLAGAVIDASGTWGTPNPLGGDGLPAVGEHEHAPAISYRVPNLRDPAVADKYAGRHVAVAGTGASAQSTLIELSQLAAEYPSTRISWLVRRASVGENAFGGGDNDQLVARGELGSRAQTAVDAGPVTTVTSFRTSAVTGTGEKLCVEALDGQRVEDVDELWRLPGSGPM